MSHDLLAQMAHSIKLWSREAMPDNEIHIGWIKTLDPKYQSLFSGTYFYFA